MAAKKKGLTLAILLGKGKSGAGGEHEDMAEDEAMRDEGESEGEEDGELPDGLLEAVSEFRSAESDEDAARALYNAMRCCE